MKLIRSIAMNTNHDGRGTPIEITRVDLHIAEEVLTPEIVALAKHLQIKLLHHSAKAMPHVYWLHPEGRPYADELTPTHPTEDAQRGEHGKGDLKCG